MGAHAKVTEPAPARAGESTGARAKAPKDAAGSTGARARIPLRLPSTPSSWVIPVAMTAVAIACIVAIAIPAAVFSHVGSETTVEAELSAEVREAPVEDVSVESFTETTSEALGESLGFGVDLATRADALAQAAARLDEAVGALRAEGFEVGYYVATPDDHEVISLNPDRLFYAASSIKGPFVLRAFPDGVPGEYRSLVEDAIQWSDNDAYYRLREYRGYDVLADQLEELGVDGFTRTMSFIWMTPRQLAALWERNLGTLGIQGESGDWLRQTFSATSNSALGALPARGAFPVTSAYSKAGWIETGELSCTVDAGAITFPASPIVGGAEDGDSSVTYIVSVMIDKGEDFEAAAGIVNALADYLYALANLG